jgi:hypothetical protein
MPLGRQARRFDAHADPGARLQQLPIYHGCPVLEIKPRMYHTVRTMIEPPMSMMISSLFGFRYLNQFIS